MPLIVAIILGGVLIFLWDYFTFAPTEITEGEPIPSLRIGDEWVFGWTDFENKKIIENFEIIGEEDFGDLNCYVLTSSMEPAAKFRENVTVDGRRVLIDKATLKWMKYQLLYENVIVTAEGVQVDMAFSRTFSEPLWPITTGKEITMEVGTRFMDYPTVHRDTYFVKVGPVENLILPGGIFEAIRIGYEKDNLFIGEEWYSPRAKYFVRLVGMETNLPPMELKDFSLVPR